MLKMILFNRMKGMMMKKKKAARRIKPFDAGAYELPAAGALPLTERCSAGAVMLPTDVSPEDAERIAGIVVRVAGR